MTSCLSQKISLSDLFPAEEIQRVQDAFALASNVASVISAPDGTPLTRPSNYSESFATFVHGRDAVETGHVFPASVLRPSAAAGLAVHVCPLTDLLYAGMPIIVGGCHVANWVIGQVRDEDMAKGQTLALAGRIGADPAAVEVALEGLPRMSRARFDAVADSMALIAGHVFRQAYRTQCLCTGDAAEVERRVWESEERFRAVFDSVSDAIFIHDWPSGAFVDANERAVSMFGYTRNELLDMALVDLCEDRKNCATDVASFLSSGFARGRGVAQWRVRSKCGEVFRVEVSLRFVHVGGTPYVVACVHDVEERVSAEAAIVRERRFSDAVMDSVPGLLYLYDESGRLVRWNRQHSTVTGYSDQELAGMYLYDWYKDDPETIDKIRAAIARVYDEGSGYEEAMLRTKSGERIPFFLTAVRLEFDGRNYFTGIGIDISERRKAELALRESEARYRSVIENIQDTYYRTDAGGALVMLSPSGASLLGYENADELLGTPMEKLWKYPEAFQEYVEILSEQGVVRELEATLLRRDGSEVVVEATSNIYSDESGFMLGLEGILRDIGKRKEAEREAARERMFTDAVMESVPGLLFIYDSQERMVRWNRNYETMTGYSPEELFGSDAAAWFGGREPDTSTILASFRQAMIQGRSEAEALLVTKGGRRIPCLFTVARHTIDGRAYLVGMGMDITERKKSEELLLQSENKFALLFRHSPDAILLADIETGIVSDVNDTFVSMTGYARDEIVGRTTGSINFYVDPALWGRLYAMLRRDGHLANRELMVRTRDGHALVCALSSHVLQIGDQSIVMSVYRNVTELKKMQEMMIQTEKMVSIGGIAAGIAHEINNPLGIIMQSAQLLEQRTQPDFPRNMAVAEGMGLDLRLLDRYMRERNILGYVRDIREAAKRAADIIRHMLDFSRRSDSEHKLCFVNDIIDRAIALAGSDYDLRKSFDFKRIQIIRDFQEQMPGIRCSETEIEQVVLNLLRNAAQALASGSVTDPAITVRTRWQGENVVIEVEDNGPGIPSETARRIFEPFFTTKPPGQGTGLGLSVSYFIVTQTHGGSIQVRSAPDQGACFHIEIPRARM